MDKLIQIIALINQIAGVGKIICALNIEADLNELKKRVLLIDFTQGLKSLYSYLSYLFNLMILYL